MVPPLELQRFKEALDGSRKVLVLLPQNPDFDTVAAGLSFYLAGKSWGKETDISCATPMIVEFNRLVGVDKVRESLGQGTMRITFENYDASDIERVSYNIENGKFELVVLPKTGEPSPTREQVKVAYGGASGAELLVLIKVQNRASLGKLGESAEIFAPPTKLALVGNFSAQDFTSPIELINPRSASASEVVFEILQNLNWKPDPDIAANLLAGLRAGTSNFQNPGVSAETFAVASQLSQLTSQVPAAPGPTVPPPPPSQPTQEPNPQPPEDWLAPKVYKGSTLP